MARLSTFLRGCMLVACTLVFASASADPAAAQTAVTTCGQITFGRATLNADLDCTGFDGNALNMGGGTLTMNGHSIIGGTNNVWCDLHPCKIVGPGTLTGSDFAGVLAFGVGLKMSQVDVTNQSVFGVQVWKNVTITGPAVLTGNGAAIRVRGKANLKNLTITGNNGGIDATNAQKGSISIEGSTVSNNASGLTAQRSIKVVDTTVTNNGTSGVYVAGGFGCERKAAAILVRSTVTGNGTDPSCGSTTVCADLATCKQAPRVNAGSTCGTSYQIDSGHPGSDWDVCTFD